MPDYSDLDHVKEFNIQPEKHQSAAPWIIFALVMVLPFLCMIAYLTANKISSGYIENVDKEFTQHMRAEATNYGDALSAWMNEKSAIANRITKSFTIQNFIINVNETEQAGGVLPNELQLQTKFIEETLTTFAKQNNLAGVHLINRRAQPIASSQNAFVIPANYEALSRESFTEKQLKFGSARANETDIIIDIYIPIAALQTRMGEESFTNVGVVIMSVPLGEKLKEVFKKSPVSLDGQITRLFQKEKESASLISFEGDLQGIFTQDATHKDKDYKTLWRLYGMERDGKHDLRKIPQFGQQGILPRVGEVILIRQKVKSTPFVILSVLDLKEAYADALLYRKQAQIIAQLIAVLIFITFVSFWWRYQVSQQRLISSIYQNFASTTNTQRNLFVNINNAVDEHISLKYFDGHYIYVNPAFAKSVGLKPKDMIGKTDKDIFDEKTAKILHDLDKELLKKKTTVAEEISVNLNDKRHYFSISKEPFRDSAGNFTGIVTIAKDVTEIVAERIMREKALRNSMRALTRIMERHDLYLVKHAKYLNHITKALGKKLKLNAEEMMTLEICANLNQIGMIFVDKEILKSPANKRNDQDTLAYNSHIEDSAYILDTVDWGLPIVKNTYSMHERLDGTGYPSGLKDDKIGQLTRILSVCHVFCALTAPRHGEKVYTPEEAIKYLVNDKGAYDLKIIRALAELISENEEILMIN